MIIMMMMMMIIIIIVFSVDFMSQINKKKPVTNYSSGHENEVRIKINVFIIYDL